MNDNKLTIFCLVILGLSSWLIPHYASDIVNPVSLSEIQDPEVLTPWTTIWHLITFQVATGAIVVSFVYDLVIGILIIQLARLIRGVSA